MWVNEEELGGNLLEFNIGHSKHIRNPEEIEYNTVKLLSPTAVAAAGGTSQNGPSVNTGKQ